MGYKVAATDPVKDTRGQPVYGVTVSDDTGRILTTIPCANDVVADRIQKEISMLIEHVAASAALQDDSEE